MNNHHSKYIILRNPHDGEYKMFHFEENKQAYAPNYGCPIASGSTRQECLEIGCERWDIDPSEVL